MPINYGLVSVSLVFEDCLNQLVTLQSYLSPNLEFIAKLYCIMLWEFEKFDWMMLIKWSVYSFFPFYLVKI